MEEKKVAQAEPKTEPKKKVQLTISQIKKDLNDGIDRKGIAKKYHLSFAEVARLFQHEKLKGLKVKSAPTVDLIDDLPDEGDKSNGKTKANKEPVAQAETEVAQPGPGEAVSTAKGTW